MQRILSLLIFLMMLSVMQGTSNADPQDYNHDASVAIAQKTKVDALLAKSAILMDVDSGRILINKNPDEKLAIASITKIMTSLIIMEALDNKKISLDTPIKASAGASSIGGSEVYLKEGEVFTLDELLKAIFIHSANDACYAVAEHLSLSETVFVEEMNRRAKALGMNNTNFVDCMGLADENHYSSARDIGLMSRELLLKHPKAMEYSKILHDTFRNGKFMLDNTNRLVQYYNGTTGLKTGFTSKASYCLSASAQRNGVSLIAVVLGEPDNNSRFGEATCLLDYGFAKYQKKMLIKKGEDCGEISVHEGLLQKIKTVSKDPFITLINGDEEKQIKITKQLLPALTAPVEFGAKVGTVSVMLGEKEMTKIDILSAQKVERASFFRRLFRRFVSWFGITI